MPPKKLDLQKHTMNLRAGDYARIADACLNKDYNASDVIRRLVSRYVDELESIGSNTGLNEVEDIQL